MDIPGIKQIIKPLEESGTLVRRTDEQVCAMLLFRLSFLFECPIFLNCLIIIGGTSLFLDHEIIVVDLITFLLLYYKCHTIIFPWNWNQEVVVLITFSMFLDTRSIRFIQRRGKRRSNHCMCCPFPFLWWEVRRDCCYCCISWMPWTRARGQITWYDIET